MEMGERLRCIRESKKMTIYKLSQETGISHNHISDLERGVRKPSVETIRRLITPLGITLSEFFNEDGEIIYLSQREQELIYNFRALPSKQANGIFELIRVMND